MIYVNLRHTAGAGCVLGYRKHLKTLIYLSHINIRYLCPC